MMGAVRARSNLGFPAKMGDTEVCMKRIAIGIGVLVALWLGPVLWAGSPAAGEVVTLTTTDSAGTSQKTPLWIVDKDGVAWLRAGNEQAKWLARIRANPRVELERGDKTTTHRAALVPEATAEINALVAEKYGFADRLVGWLVPNSRTKPLAVRLDPESP